MSMPAEGIIVAYQDMVGVALIRHHSWPDLGSLAEDYLFSFGDFGYWFAKFSLSGIEPECRELITSLQLGGGGARTKKSPPKRRKNAKCPGIHIRDLILGRPVSCRVAKTPKWEATNIWVDLEGAPFPLPERHRRVLDSGQVRRVGNSGLAERIANRINQQSPSNLRRPWGGFK